MAEKLSWCAGLFRHLRENGFLDEADRVSNAGAAPVSGHVVHSAPDQRGRPSRISF
jgi:hypothetical protein